MNTLSFTFLFTVLSTISAVIIEEGYTQLNVQDFINDVSTSNLIYSGSYSMLDDLINSKGALPGANYVMNNVTSIYARAAVGLYYRFDAIFTSDIGITFRATFTLYTEPWLGTSLLVSYAYALPDDEITKNEKFIVLDDGVLPVNYYQVDPSQLDHDIDLHDALFTGIPVVSSYLVGRGKLPDSTYMLSEIQSIYAQNVGGTNFRFNVVITNCAGLKARVVFWSYSLLAMNSLTVSSVISVDVITIPEEGLVGDCQANQDNNVESEIIVNEEIDFNLEEDLAEGYVSINGDEFNNSPGIQNLFISGALYVADQAIKAKKVVDTQYYLNNFYIAEGQEVSDGTNYRFYIDMINCQSDIIRATYTVHYEIATGNIEVTAYTYQVTSFPTGVYAGGCLTPAEENGEEEQVLSQVEEYALVLATWTVLNVSEISLDVQSAMSFGFQQLIEHAIENKNLPDQVYQQTNLVSAEMQAGEAINYRFYAKVQSTSMVYDINYGVYFDPAISYQQLTFYILSTVKDQNEIISQGSL